MKRTIKLLDESKLVQLNFCSREDLAKEKIVFSQESSRAIFEMGNVEVIELKTSLIQCPSCLQYVFRGHFFANAVST